MLKIFLAGVVSVALVTMTAATPPLSLVAVGTLKTGPFRAEDPRGAEINAYDPTAHRIYVVNPLAGRIDVIDASDPTAPVAADPVDIVAACQAALGTGCPMAPGGEPNSVAVHDGLLAVAASNPVRTSNGHAVFFELRGAQRPSFLAVVEVGAVPDMITFTDDGTYALTANEGEPDTSYVIDPPGTVSIIEIARLGTPQAVQHVGFDKFDRTDVRAKLEADGVRIFGPNASVAQDLEPEYIAAHDNKAYVTLQENNALAIINIAAGTVEKIVGLGLKDHLLPQNALDANDQDNINIRNWPVHGLYQADAVAAFADHGRSFLIMANEGDSREYAAYVEAVRLGNAAYPLDPTVFPGAATLLKPNTLLGRVNVSKGSGDLDGDGDYDRIDIFGGRSVSIRDQQGRLLWDSADMFERLSQANDLAGVNLFNTTNSANARENRSDDKGVEPESVVVGNVGGRQYAFVGLERDSGIVVLDLTTPEQPVYVTYANRRKFPRNAAGALLPCSDATDCGDLGPEGLTFVPAEKSASGTALLIVSNEVSGTTTIWKVQ